MARFKKEISPEVAGALQRAAAFLLECADANGERFLSRSQEEHDELVWVFTQAVKILRSAIEVAMDSEN